MTQDTPTILWLLLDGWYTCLCRVVPQVTIDPRSVWIGVIALFLFTGLLHGLGRRIYTPARPELPRAWPWRWTFGLVAFCGLLFASGLSAVGLLRSVQWLAMELGRHTA
jgi:hypothetical protein